MRHYRHGLTSVGIVVGIVALIAAGGLVWYFVSDPFSSRVDSTLDQMTKWTPENIAKNPVGYLDFCEKKTKQAMEDLKADSIAIAMNKGKLSTMRDEAQAKVNVGDKALTELKDLYEKNQDSASWPVQWREQKLDKDQVKRQVVNTHKQVEQQKALVSKAEAGLKKLDAQVQKIEDARSTAQQQLAEIAANKQLLSVNKLTDDLKVRLVNMKGAIEATVATAAESGGTVSLDQLAAEASTTVSDSEFDKIMKK